MVCDEIGDKVI